MTQPVPQQRLPAAMAAWGCTIAMGVALKLWLLLTSQSMVDSDEAVEGLMALHILRDGAHPIYPYGVNYGAGGGWEAHVAAAIFAVAGPSDIAVKSVGLIHYLLTLGLVAALAGHWRGRTAALVAAGLFAAAPQTAQWALKACGGHQVGIVVALSAWYCSLRGWKLAALALMPLAVLAHPSMTPFITFVGLQFVWRAGSWKQRVMMLLAAVAVAGVEYLMLRPPGESVWNPAAQGYDPIALLITMPRLAWGLFCPNLNSPDWPGGWQAVVALLWLIAVVVSACRREQPSANVWALLACWGVLLLVGGPNLAPRHLFIASPLSAIVLACAPATSAWARLVPVVLVISGCAVQVAEVDNPNMVGAGSQARGVDRANFQAVMRELEAKEIRHVYCVDPMLQWNIVFASREKILARWIAPRDRVPKYVEEVDLARRSGKPTALVLPVDPMPPVKFAVISPPPAKVINAYFQPAAMSGRD